MPAANASAHHSAVVTHPKPITGWAEAMDRRQTLAEVLLLLTAALRMRRCPMYTNPTDFFMMLMKQEPESRKLREAWESAERAALEALKLSEVGCVQRDICRHLHGR